MVSVEEDAASGVLPTLKVNAPGVRVEAGFAADGNEVVVVENNDDDGADVAENNGDALEVEDVNSGEEVAIEVEGIGVEAGVIPKLNNPPAVDGAFGAGVEVKVEEGVTPKLNNPVEVEDGAVGVGVEVEEGVTPKLKDPVEKGFAVAAAPVVGVSVDGAANDTLAKGDAVAVDVDGAAKDDILAKGEGFATPLSAPPFSFLALGALITLFAISSWEACLKTP